MLGRKDYTREELDNPKARIGGQVAADHALAQATTASGGKKAGAALDEFGAQFFNNLVLVLDRLFVHRLRVSAGKDRNPLNEVELLAESLMNNGGLFRGNNVIKHVPEQSMTRSSRASRSGSRPRTSSDCRRPFSPTSSRSSSVSPSAAAGFEGSRRPCRGNGAR